MRASVRSLFVFMIAMIAISGFAAEPVADLAPNAFIAIADPETGRALVPEGTVVPAGVRFYLRKIDGSLAEDAPASGPGQALVFAYAPESAFTKARVAIAAARQTTPDAERRFVANPQEPKDRVAANAFGIAPNAASTQYIYLWFDDGSYLETWRYVNVTSTEYQYGVGTTVWCEATGYSRATVRAKQSSNLVWGPTGGPYFDPYGYSKTCSDYSGGGVLCQTSHPVVYAKSSSFSAVVKSEASITQRFYDCWSSPEYPYQPCIVSYAGTIEVRFP